MKSDGGSGSLGPIFLVQGCRCFILRLVYPENILTKKWKLCVPIAPIIPYNMINSMTTMRLTLA
ncbi:hypothetical protein GCM10020370_35810 [Paenibacillus hodogayensis]